MSYSECKNIFLDFNATTPVFEETVNEMQPYWNKVFGNPSSVHSYGRKCREAINHAREQVACSINANTSEIIFTSGGTEANNMALHGLERIYNTGRKHIIISSIEHSSIYEPAMEMQKRGFEISVLPVNTDGLVNPEEYRKLIKPETSLISVIMANNETGVIQNIQEISEISSQNRIVTHTDAVQALGKLPVNVDELGVDLLSISAHKIYGPKGCGALYIRNSLKIEPFIYGGGQENKLRSGTENVPSIAGFGKACEMASKNLDAYTQHTRKLREQLEKSILDKIPCAKVNCSNAPRLPNTSSISFSGHESERLVIQLDMEGICVSSGSACSSLGPPGSRVLKALNLPAREQFSTLRFSIGQMTTSKEIDRTVRVLAKIIG